MTSRHRSLSTGVLLHQRALDQRTNFERRIRCLGFRATGSLSRRRCRINRGDFHRIRLLQWLEPFDPEPAYPPPINHKGINRLALTVPDVERAVAILKSQDVPFLSEVAPCCSGTDTDTGGIVHAIDPDGVFLELVGDLEPRPVPPQPAHCPPLELRYPE